MKIFLIAGKAGSGKHNVATFIKEYFIYQKQETVITGYSKYLKLFAEEIIGWDRNENEKPRKFLQDLGVQIRTNLGMPDFFTDRMLDDITVYEQFADVVVVDDVLRFGTGQTGQQFGSAGIGIDQGIFNDLQQIGSQTLTVGAFHIKIPQSADRFTDLTLMDVQVKIDLPFDGSQSEDVLDFFKFQFLRIISQTLFKNGQGITHAAFRHSCNLHDRFFFIRNLLFIKDLAGFLFDLIGTDLAKIETLAARHDGRQDLLRIGRCQNEDHVCRWFFQCLQERVESGW